MSEKRSSHPMEIDGARLLGRTDRRDRATVADLALAEELRLSERQRLIARGLLDRIVRTVEDELRASLCEQFADNEALHAVLSSGRVAITGPVLAAANALDDPELVQLLLRRVEEHRLYLAAAGRSERLHALLADRDGDVAAEAMAVLVARSRRLDRFQEPVLARTELPADLQHRLVWTVAAALRAYLVGMHRVGPAIADAALGDVAADALAGYDEGDRLEARCQRLVQRLRCLGRLDGAAIADFLSEGTLPLFIAGLSAVTGIAAAAVWAVLNDPAGCGPVLLLRAADLDRQAAGECLLLLADIPDDDRLISQLSMFDALSPPEATRALGLWSLAPAYREALLRLGESKRSA